MTITLQLALDIVCFILSFVCMIKTGNLLFRKKPFNLWLFLLPLIVYIALKVSLIYANKLGFYNYIITMAVNRVVLVFAPCLAFYGKATEKIEFAVIFIAMAEFAANGVGSLLNMISILLPFDRASGEIIAVFSIFFGNGLLYLLFSRSCLSEGHFSSHMRKVSYTALLLMGVNDICGCAITQGIVIRMSGLPEGSKYNEFLTHTGVAFLSTLSLIIMAYMLFTLNRFAEYSAAEKVKNSRIDFYKSTLCRYKNQSELRHDMKNHIISLSALAKRGEWEKLEGYLSGLREASDIENKGIDTGSPVTDGILYAKKREAEKLGIEFKVDVNFSGEMQPDQLALGIIWGNLLDNAVAGAEKAEEVVGKKQIIVQANSLKNGMVIDIKNTASINRKNSGFGKANYGTGLKNVENAVDRYGGTMEIKAEGNIFEATVFLPSY